VTLFDPIADADAFPAAERVSNETNLLRAPSAVAPYVIVATQGIWDEEALASALRRDAAYVGLVASPTRAAVVRQWLAEEAEVPPERLAALRAPAGLDLGAETPAEIAVSILAELVQVRRGRAAFVAAPGPATVAGTTLAAPEPVVDDIVLVDPVCGMTVDRRDARHLAEYDGKVYAFCQISCRTRFIKDPTAYVQSSVSSAPNHQSQQA
jgi:xanthine dehydrogenase accessory factor